MKISTGTAARLLKSFGINPPASDPHYLAHAPKAQGTPLSVECYRDFSLGPCLRVLVSDAQVGRACPLIQADAEALVAALHATLALPRSVREDRTLEHLLLRCSELFTDMNLVQLHLDCYLTDKGYVMYAAHLESEKTLHISKKLAGNAHDRGAAFDYRPTQSPTGLKRS